MKTMAISNIREKEGKIGQKNETIDFGGRQN